MTHQNDGHCGGAGADHDHDHDHAASDLGPQDNLFSHIDRDNVVAFNTSSRGSVVIKPWHRRLDETEALLSEADDQIIIRIPFTGSVRLRSLLLKAGPSDQTPSKVKLYANQANMDFNDVDDILPTQEFDVPQGREVGEYALKTAKFSNISSVALFFPSSQGADSAQIYYIGFLGQWTEHKNKPVIAVYEAKPNLADHEKVQGIDGVFSTSQT